jgi:hypothetical protein
MDDSPERIATVNDLRLDDLWPRLGEKNIALLSVISFQLQASKSAIASLPFHNTYQARGSVVG